MKLHAILLWLQEYPERTTALLLFNGFSSGFLLPKFEGKGCQIVKNLKSTMGLQHIVGKKIFKEIQMGRVAGPFLFPPFKDFRLSPLVIVPKKEPNSYHLIHHLSFPAGCSLNDQIQESVSSVSYASFEDALVILKKLGSGALLAKALTQSVLIL